MPAEEVRIATTESLFRSVNERIAESAQKFEADEAEFVCECDDRTCTDRVGASLEDYERVRANATHFLLKPGHENERVERVVLRMPGYRVVEKINRTVAATVRRLDPRAQPA